jgi:hypothetical protein
LPQSRSPNIRGKVNVEQEHRCERAAALMKFLLPVSYSNPPYRSVNGLILKPSNLETTGEGRARTAPIAGRSVTWICNFLKKPNRAVGFIRHTASVEIHVIIIQLTGW